MSNIWRERVCVIEKGIEKNKVIHVHSIGKRPGREAILFYENFHAPTTMPHIPFKLAFLLHNIVFFGKLSCIKTAHAIYIYIYT